MREPRLTRFTSQGVTLLGDSNRPGGVTLAFTERTGGVSVGDYSSLNLGDACGDDPALVAENRRILLSALGAEDLLGSLVNPLQVHGDHVVVVRSGEASGLREAVAEARAGADAVVCTAADVPVLLCYADCVPVLLAVPGGFSVIHSGWRGTVARITGKALEALLGETGAQPRDVRAYIGPHVGAADYEVSPELAGRFASEFGEGVLQGKRNLDLAAAIRATLAEHGVGPSQVSEVRESTASSTDRFFSYRAEDGRCGRHGAIALMRANR